MAMSDDPQVRRRWRREALLVTILAGAGAVCAGVAAGDETLGAVALGLFCVRRGSSARCWSSTRSAAARIATAKSRSEALHRPASTLAPIPKAVVQAVGSALPELDGIGAEPVAAPALRTRDLVGVFRRQRRAGLLELGARGDRQRLAAGPGPELRAAGRVARASRQSPPIASRAEIEEACAALGGGIPRLDPASRSAGAATG